jgi:hypothetical protein
MSDPRTLPDLHADCLGRGAIVPDDDARCAVCGGPRFERGEEGCVRGACGTRPQPVRFYAVRRVCREYQRMIVDTGVVHQFYTC